jgi:hypothetical protein
LIYIFCGIKLDKIAYECIGGGDFMLYLEKISKMFGNVPYKEKIEMAKNPCTLKETQLKLAKEKDGLIKITLAHRSGIDTEVVDKLLADPSPNVRFALINCTNMEHISSEHLEKLAEDPEEFIRNRAKELLAQRVEKEGIPPLFFAVKKIRADSADSRFY